MSKITVDCSKDNRTNTSGPSCTVVDVTARMTFLISLQHRHEAFWRSLNDLWRRGHENKCGRWLQTHNVLDQWLADVAAETITRWSKEPESPAANLVSGYLWFGCVHWPEADLKYRRFAPRFKDPSPIFKGPDNLNEMLRMPLDKLVASVRLSFRDSESLEDFRRRMEKQFQAQLKAYLARLQRRKSQTRAHADWAALKFAGKSYPEIARTELAKSPHRDAEQAVRKAVLRFAGSIGLTLTRETEEQLTRQPRSLARSTAAAGSSL